MTGAAVDGQRIFPDWHEPCFAQWLAGVKRAGVPVVVANGVFDLFHAGHVALLEFAAVLPALHATAAVLLVAVNADASTARLKGAGRPFVPLYHRLMVLRSLRYVDVAVGFTEDTPLALVEFVRPYCIVKGAEYAGQGTSPEAKHTEAGIVYAPMTPFGHTTDLVRRINACAGAS